MNGRAWWPAFVVGLLIGVSAKSDLAARQLAVAWDDAATGAGMVRARSASAPWDFTTEPIEVGSRPILRFAGDRLYAVSPADDTVTVISPDEWSIQRTYTLPPGSAPLDIAVTGGGVAYIAREKATHLLRLDLQSGATQEVVDLGIFADADGTPDLGTMAVHNGRLFVQIRRWNFDQSPPFSPPAYLAVVDIGTEQLVDVDPASPGVQAIGLSGTPPKFKMQVLPQTDRLFVGASGGFFDDGGIEVVDLKTLGSAGLVIREDAGLIGADLGAFVMLSSDRGYLSFTTDLILSSHLAEFSLSGGVVPGTLIDVVDYFAPAIEFDPRTENLFFPVSGSLDDGVLVFDAATGARLTRNVLGAGGPPTDLLLLPSLLPGDTNADGLVNIDDLNAVRNYFGAIGPSDGTLAGDAYPFDGRVNIDDLNAVRNHFGETSPGVVVPEPATGVLTIWGGLAVALFFRVRAFLRAG